MIQWFGLWLKCLFSPRQPVEMWESCVLLFINAGFLRFYCNEECGKTRGRGTHRYFLNGVCRADPFPSVPPEADGSPVSEIEGPFTTADVASNCVSSVSFHEPVLWIASYALMSLCGIILLVLLVLLLIPPRCQHRYTDNDVVNDESSLVRHRWKWEAGSQKLAQEQGKGLCQGEEASTSSVLPTKRCWKCHQISCVVTFTALFSNAGSEPKHC